jgi:hypothetical protein
MSEHGWLDDLLTKEESRHPVPAGLRKNVVATVTAEHGAEHRTSRVLVLAAAALVAVVVGSLIAVGRLAHPRGAVPAHRPTPVASPTPGERDYGPVPAGVAVTYAIDPREPSWLIAYDASGRPVGTVKLPVSVQLSGSAAYAVSASPGGDLIIAGDRVYNRAGQPIAPAPAVKGQPVIADDQRHLCDVVLDQSTFDETLVTQALGQPEQTVKIVNREQGVGQTGDRVVLCSFQHDVAVVVRTAIAWPTDAWFIRLTTGAILHHLSFPSQAYGTIVASADGAYIAENPSGSAPNQQLRIVRVADGAVVAQLGARYAFHFLGDQEVVTTSENLLPTVKGVSLIDWATGKALWSYQGPEWVDFMQPLGSTAWVVFLAEPQPANPTTVTPPCDRVLLVGADGAQTDITGVNLYPVQSF